ncbi:MAG: hypothetical protein EOS36_00585 [Mesorhizobium sp.]|uniref:hypothetical protein n=1 Tax=Mesorhizobium sp. TaxID=1871066 RepID=UPI000FE99499|nr:hypothetical protein [Mesorhizobium sp.]RWD68071.1 MAG: hypothetical protein EOS36_00585 [Mesorhizobium sp.]RWE51148.1 MAG: hypothetical protein EOS79_01510 [Mesorhizobium sp.]
MLGPDLIPGTHQSKHGTPVETLFTSDPDRQVKSLRWLEMVARSSFDAVTTLSSAGARKYPGEGDAGVFDWAILPSLRHANHFAGRSS